MNKNKFIAITSVVTLLVGCSGSPELSNLSATATLNDIYKIVSTGQSLSFNALTGGVNDLAINPVTREPGIVYYDKSATASGTTAVGALKYAYRDGGAWFVELVDANYGTAVCGTAGGFCVGAPNGANNNTSSIVRIAYKSNGQPVIAYVFGASSNGAGTKDVRYAERSTSGTWTISIPFSSSTSAGVSNVSVTANIDPIKALTLNFDSADRPHITFTMYTQTQTNSAIWYLFKSSTGSWTSTSITSALTAGTITNTNQGNNQAGGARCAANDMMVWTGKVVDTAAGVGNPIFIRCTAVNSSGACTTFSTLDLLTGCGGLCFAGSLAAGSDAGHRTDVVIDAATQRPLIGIYSTATPNNTLVTSTAPNACSEAQGSTVGSWGTPVSVAAGSAGINGFRLAASNASSNKNYLSYLVLTTAVHVNKATGPAGAWLATGTLLETATVASEGVGMDYDATNDALYVSYAATPAGALGAIGNDIKVAHGMDADISNAGAAGFFALDTVDTTTSFFPTTAIPTVSAAKSPRGTYGYAFFFQDNTAADQKLYYGIRGGTATYPTFSAHTVVNHIEGGAGLYVGSYPSLAYDYNSNPIIAFYNGVATEQNLNVAQSSNGGTSFSVTAVDKTAANVGLFPSVDTYGTAIGIAYQDSTNSGLKFARFLPQQGWRKFAVDGMAGTGSCGNASDNAGSYATLRFSSTGRPVITYQSQTNLKIAYASEAITSPLYSWTCYSIDSSAATRGAGIAMVLSSTDQPHILHFDATDGTIRHVKCSTDIATCITNGTSAFTGAILSTVGTTSTIVTKPSIQRNGSTLYASFYTGIDKGLVLAQLNDGATSWTTESLDAGNGGGAYTSLAGQYASLVINDSGYPMVFYRSRENWLKYFSRELY